MSWRDLGQIDWFSVDTKVFAGIAYLSLFTTLTTFFLLQFSIIRIGAAKAATYNFLSTIFVILLSIFLGLERFIPVTIPGILLVAGAMVMIQKEKDHRPLKKYPNADIRKTIAPQV